MGAGPGTGPGRGWGFGMDLPHVQGLFRQTPQSPFGSSRKAGMVVAVGGLFLLWVRYCFRCLSLLVLQDALVQDAV